MCPSTNISILFVALSILCMQTDVAWGHLKVTILDRWSDAQVIKKILEEKWAAARFTVQTYMSCFRLPYRSPQILVESNNWPRSRFVQPAICLILISFLSKIFLFLSESQIIGKKPCFMRQIPYIHNEMKIGKIKHCGIINRKSLNNIKCLFYTIWSKSNALL